MSTSGWAVGRETSYEQTSLTETASEGDTGITVDWAGLFSEDGGALEIGGVRHDYLAADEDTGRIVLAEPLTGDLELGEPVLTVAGGQLVVEAALLVMLGTAEPDEAAEPVPVPIPFAMRHLWPDDPEFYADPVLVTVEDDYSAVLDAPGLTAKMDGGIIDPETMPPVEASPPTTAPAQSPTPELSEGPGAAIVRFTTTGSDALHYRLHIATTDQNPPSDSTLKADSISSPSWHEAYPDGSLLPVAPTGDEQGEWAWFAIVASNGVHPDTGEPLDAPPSPWVKGRRGVEAPDVTARRITGQVIEGVSIMAPDIQTHAEPDRGIKIATDGLRAFVNAGANAGRRFFALLPDEGLAAIEGLLTARKLTVIADADPSTPVTTLGGRTNLPGRGSAVMQSSVRPPMTAPGVYPWWPTVTLQDFPTGNPVGLYRYASEDSWTTSHIVEGVRVAQTTWNGDGALDSSALTEVALEAGESLRGFVFAAGVSWVLVDTGSQLKIVNAWTRNVLATVNRTTKRWVPGLGWDAVNERLLIVEPHTTDDDMRVVRVHPESGATSTVRGPRVNADIKGATYGPDPTWSGERFAFGLSRAGNGTVAATRNPDLTVADPPRGIAGPANNYNGWTKTGDDYAALTSGGRVVRFGPHNDNRELWVSATNARGGTMSDAPQYETPQGPRAKITLPARALLAASAPELPDGEAAAGEPDRVRIYAGAGADDPGRAAMRLQAAPPPGDYAAQIATHSTDTPPPPEASNYPAATPYDLTAQTGGFRVDGNSDGDIGTGGLRDSILQIVNTVESVTINAVSPFSGSVILRRNHNRVWWEGSGFSRQSGSSDSFTRVADIPAQFRPVRTLYYSSTIWNDTTMQYRYAFVPEGEVRVQMSKPFAGRMDAPGISWAIPS